MDSNTEGTLALQTDEAMALDKQAQEDVSDRLVTLSDKLNICNQLLKDLKELSDILVRKSLQDVTLPQQE
ncbi:hypothetical protein PBY51_017359 [Eleginops maclovinus]|uniref:Uncharacterized protein n=1 Tax=Eleginops maclovinus TaxID=56733 RepID=A0AAN7XJI3_ELEMC|nr:hypothetical protein PBY51_017359 [Eleginops maclovinus]